MICRELLESIVTFCNVLYFPLLCFDLLEYVLNCCDFKHAVKGVEGPKTFIVSSTHGQMSSLDVNHTNPSMAQTSNRNENI